MAEYPILILSIISLSTTTMLAYLLRIVEYAPRVDLNGEILHTQGEFQKLSNALWYIYITFLTVGYGEYIPQTNPGRLIGIFTAVYGTILYSILVVLIQSKYALNKTQMKVQVVLTIDS
jgi:hypothetical protein